MMDGLSVPVPLSGGPSVSKGPVMETVYTVCAVVGGTILVCQVLMSLLGLGGEHDFGGHDVGHDFHVGDSHVGDTHHGDGHADDHDHGTSRFLSLLSFRTVV